MRCGLLLWALLAAGQTGTARYELRGRLAPGAAASVWLHGATAPFEDSTLAEVDGRFRFRGLAPGTYTLEVVLPGHGEMRRTVEVGPSEADRHKRVELVIEVREATLAKDAVRRNALVSVRTLAIPDKAYREFEEARRKLARRDTEGAIAHLERAVVLAPQYTAAWNHLGTIAYQTGAYLRAEHYFRQALAADPNAFEPLVNLGGVLINLNKLDEALEYNRHAVLERPNDALANAQLGATYFYRNQLDLSQPYLAAAKRLDPGHFSHPQLLLAEIYMRRGEKAAAAGELEEFLRLHPDAPAAARVRETLAKLRADERAAAPASR